MSGWTHALIAAAAILAAAPAGAALNVGDRLPVGTHAAVWVDNLAAAKAGVEANPYLKIALPDDAVVGRDRFLMTRLIARLPVTQSDPLSPLWSQIFPMTGIAFESGIEAAQSVFALNANDITETFTESFAVYSTLYSLTMEAGDPIVEWDIVYAMEYTDAQAAEVDAFLERSLVRVPERARRQRVEFSGQEIFQLTYYMDEQEKLPGDTDPLLSEDLIQEIPIIVEYAKVNNVLLLAEGRGEPLRRAIRALTDPAPEHRMSAANPHFRAAHGPLASAPGQFHFFFDINHHRDQIRNWPPAHDPWSGVLGLLGKGGAFVGRAAVDEKGFHVNTALASADNNPGGVYAVAQSAPDHSLESLRLVPSDAESFGTAAVDVAALYDWLWELTGRYDRQRLPVMNAAVLGLEAALNINIRGDLMEGARGEFVSYNRPGATPNSVSTGLAFPLAGTRERIELLNRMLERLAGPEMQMLDIESTPFEALQLWETPDPGPGGSLHMAATPAGFLMGSGGAELRELARRAMAPAGDNVRNRPEVARLLERLSPQGLRGFALIPARSVVNDLERARNSLVGTRFESTVPPRSEVEAAIGDTWWTLNSTPGRIQFSYNIASPPDYAQP